MNFIEFISNCCAKWLASKVPNKIYPSVDDQIEVYSYGFMVIVGALAKGFLLVSIASVLGVLIPAMIITLTFTSLRVIAGGFHLKTFRACMIISITQFIASAFTVQYTYNYWTYINIYSLLLFSTFTALYIIIRYVPRDTINKPIVEPYKIRKFKNWSLYYLLLWMFTMIIFTIVGWKLIVLSSCFGLLLELFSISKLGQRIYKKLDTPNILIIK